MEKVPSSHLRKDVTIRKAEKAPKKKATPPAKAKAKAKGKAKPEPKPKPEPVADLPVDEGNQDLQADATGDNPADDPK